MNTKVLVPIALVVLVALAAFMVGRQVAPAATPTVVTSGGGTVAAGPARTISVSGIGEAQGIPNIATVQVGVEIFAETAAEATGENERFISAVLETLKDAGIEEKDVQTTNYNMWVEQRYGDNGPIGIAGYRVSNQVNVVVRDVDKLGDVLAAVTDAGANNIFGINFGVEDTTALQDEARANAMENAREKAQQLADMSGVTLGKVISVSEGSVGGGVPMPMMEMAMAEAAMDGGTVSVSPGQLSYNSSVSVVFAIED